MRDFGKDIAENRLIIVSDRWDFSPKRQNLKNACLVAFFIADGELCYVSASSPIPGKSTWQYSHQIFLDEETNQVEFNSRRK
jgi:hypothetical protein